MKAVLAKKEDAMTLFGTVKLFDDEKGYGLIQPEAGGDELRFEKAAVQWGSATTAKTERRLSYELGYNEAGDACAVNLHSTKSGAVTRH